MVRVAILVVLIMAAGACVHPPKNLAGDFEPVGVADAQRQPRQGVAVRWGGTLVSTRPDRDRTCFEVVALPLDRQARPVPSDESPGRFIACAPGFYDPTVYAGGRELTVVGALHGEMPGKVGGYDYRFPLVDATTVYLWPFPRQPASGWPANVGISIGGVFGGHR